MGTAIYLLTNHISEVQYNNWGNGVWSSLLTIQGTGNCGNDSNPSTNEDYKKCIENNIKNYDLKDIWNSDYWKTWYQLKINSTSGDHGNIKNKFLQLGSWEKFREICTKGIDDLIKKQDWNKLDGAMGPSSAGNNYIQYQDGISYEECLKAKPVEKK